MKLLKLGRKIARMHGVGRIDDLQVGEPRLGTDESIVFKVRGQPVEGTPEADAGLEISAEFSIHWRDL